MANRQRGVERRPEGHRRLVEDDSVRVVLGGRDRILVSGTGAQEDERAANPLQDVRKVLGAHDRVLHRPEHRLAGELADGVLHEGRGRRVVVGDGVAGLDLDVGGQAVGRGDRRRHPSDERQSRRPRLARDGPHRPGDERGLRDDVRRRPGDDVGDRDDHRVEGVDLAGDGDLQGDDDLRGDGDRVGGEVRGRRVPAATADGDPDRVAGREQRARPEDDRARLVARADVEAVRPDQLRGRLFEQALLEHEAGAVEALLAGLEHEEDVAREPLPPLDQEPCRIEQHGDVRVMPAGVHHAGDLRGEVEARVLLERQGVHVGPEQDRWAGACTLDQRGDRGDRSAEDGLEAEPPQLLRDDRLGRRQVEPHLRAAVQAAPDGHDVGEPRHGGGEQLMRNRRSGGLGRHGGSMPSGDADESRDQPSPRRARRICSAWSCECPA